MTGLISNGLGSLLAFVRPIRHYLRRIRHLTDSLPKIGLRTSWCELDHRCHARRIDPEEIRRPNEAAVRSRHLRVVKTMPEGNLDGGLAIRPHPPHMLYITCVSCKRPCDREMICALACTTKGDVMENRSWTSRQRSPMALAPTAATGEARLIHSGLAGRCSIKAAQSLPLIRPGVPTGGERAVLHLRDPASLRAAPLFDRQPKPRSRELSSAGAVEAR